VCVCVCVCTLRGTRGTDRHFSGEHARGGGGGHSHSRLVDANSFTHVLLYLLQGVGFGGFRQTVVPTAMIKSVTRILCTLSLSLARSSLARSLLRACSSPTRLTPVPTTLISQSHMHTCKRMHTHTRTHTRTNTHKHILSLPHTTHTHTHTHTHTKTDTDTDTDTDTHHTTLKVLMSYIHAQMHRNTEGEEGYLSAKFDTVKVPWTLPPSGTAHLSLFVWPHAVISFFKCSVCTRDQFLQVLCVHTRHI